ncbi:hypothetical protein QFC22_002544 [Naganishia vaughanmartiniae]|uniref:Uncharacterized protein n=1 Tax=Naganishia vaughanmartiniae TaxID=1424756 RepID=A0ACC2XB47_9TREE|nr:hypothetical protein QFC22_002544 [Naganishia vaughanmartiniae]
MMQMFPDNPSLLGLNVNKGSKILLRLRPPQAPDTFYEVEQLVLVMLHELTHNVYSPHDASFYKLLGELEEEWYALKRKGYSGEGFHSNGARLGGYHSVPEHIGRIKALEAAEKRRVKSTLMGKGGRLGGAAVAGEGVRKSPREMAVEAAERRLRDESSCSHDSPSAVAEAAKAASQSMGRDAVDLTASDGSSDSHSDNDHRGDEGKVSNARNPEEEQVFIDLVSDEETSPTGTGIPEKKSRKRIFPPALADTESKARIVPTTEHDATLGRPVRCLRGFETD